MSPNCLAELVASYIEGSLAPVDRLRFLLRLLTCRTLRRYVEGLRCLAPLLGYIPRVPPPPEAARRMLRRFRGWTVDAHPTGGLSNGRLVA